MGDILYRHREGTVLNRADRGGVLKWDGGCLLRCPCGDRLCNLQNHTIQFDADGVLTVQESIASHESPSEGGKEYCHFFIKGGRVEMCDNARCNGAKPPPTRG